MTPQERKAVIESRLKTALSPLVLEVLDESHLHVGHIGAKNGASHFALKIVSAEFTTLSLVKRHQWIYQILKDLIPHEIHALKINAMCPPLKSGF